MLDFKWVFSIVSVLFSPLEATSTLSHSPAYQQFKQFTTPTLRCQRQTVKRGKTKCLPTSLSDYWTLFWLISQQCYNSYVSNGNASIAVWYVEMYIRLYCYMSNRNAHGISLLFSLHPPPTPSPTCQIETPMQCIFFLAICQIEMHMEYHYRFHCYVSNVIANGIYVFIATFK